MSTCCEHVRYASYLIVLVLWVQAIDSMPTSDNDTVNYKLEMCPLANTNEIHLLTNCRLA